jgi:hypothetical protein
MIASSTLQQLFSAKVVRPQSLTVNDGADGSTIATSTSPRTELSQNVPIWFPMVMGVSAPAGEGLGGTTGGTRGPTAIVLAARHRPSV